MWNPTTCSCKNRKYLGSIIKDSVMKLYTRKLSQMMKKQNKNSSNKFKKKCTTCKTQKIYILLAFL